MMRRAIPAAVAAVMAPLLLVGCVPLDEEAVASDLQARIVSEVKGVDGALVGFAYDGGARTASVKLYAPGVESAEVDEVARMMDESFGILWRTLPFEPAHIALGLVDGPKTENATTGDRDTVRIDEAWRELGLKGGGTELYIARNDSLVARYGEWTAP